MAEEKTEFVEKYFALMGLYRVDDLRDLNAGASRVGSWIFFTLSVLFFAAFFFFDIGLKTRLLEAFPEFDRFEQALWLKYAFLLLFVFCLLTSFNKMLRRRFIVRDLYFLKVLLDYMRVGKMHFEALVKHLVPGASDSDYRSFVDRVFSLYL